MMGVSQKSGRKAWQILSMGFRLIIQNLHNDPGNSRTHTADFDSQEFHILKIYDIMKIKASRNWTG